MLSRYNGAFSSKSFLESPKVLSPSLKVWDHGAQGCPSSRPGCPSAPRSTPPSAPRCRALTGGAAQPLVPGLNPEAALPRRLLGAPQGPAELLGPAPPPCPGPGPAAGPGPPLSAHFLAAAAAGPRSGFVSSNPPRGGAEGRPRCLGRKRREGGRPGRRERPRGFFPRAGLARPEGSMRAPGLPADETPAGLPEARSRRGHRHPLPGRRVGSAE